MNTMSTYYDYSTLLGGRHRSYAKNTPRRELILQDRQKINLIEFFIFIMRLKF